MIAFKLVPFWVAFSPWKYVDRMEKLSVFKIVQKDLEECPHIAFHIKGIYV